MKYFLTHVQDWLTAGGPANPLDPAAQFVLALFSGMALAGLANMALLKPL